MSPNKIIIGLLIGFFGIIAGAFYLVQKDSAPQVLNTSYKATDSEKPTAQVKQTFYDLGQMKVSDEKYADFQIENKGTKSLQITSMRSSCGCTVGKVIYKGTETKEFGMHSQGLGVISEIAPSSGATVRIIYRPFVMPVYGYVEREVYFETNDPLNPKINLKVKANVR